MSRISFQNLAEAISTVQAMDLKTKEQFADEIYRTQPNMLASVIVLGRFGVSMEKIDFALNILLVCFTAMKISGLVWPRSQESHKKINYMKNMKILKIKLSAPLKIPPK